VNRRQGTIVWWGCLALLGLVAVVYGLRSQRLAVAAQQEASVRQALLAQYEAILAVMPPSDQRAFLEEKVAPLQTQEAARQQALKQPRPTKPANPEVLRPQEPLTAQAMPREPGIFEDILAPVSPDDFTTRNGWQWEVNGQWVRVFAGAHTYQPEQGALIVLPEGAVKETWVEGPAGAGALRIVAEQGLTLLVEAADGTRLVFDLRTNALAAPAP
jgi:hypothetical protein